MDPWTWLAPTVVAAVLSAVMTGAATWIAAMNRVDKDLTVAIQKLSGHIDRVETKLDGAMTALRVENTAEHRVMQDTLERLEEDIERDIGREAKMLRGETDEIRRRVIALERKTFGHDTDGALNR